MLGRHPLTRENAHDVAVRNHLYNQEEYMNDQDRYNLMNLAMQQHHQENSIENSMDDAARFHDDFHHYSQHHDNEANEAKYRVFLDSRSIPA